MPYQIVEHYNTGPISQNGIGAISQTGIDISLNSTVPFSTIYDTNDSVFGKLKNLLLTRLGERPLQPNFGTDLFKILFEVASDELQTEIEDYIVPQISYWIPEITINAIRVTTLLDDPTLDHTISLSINYTINGLNQSSITLNLNESGLMQIQQGQ